MIVIPIDEDRKSISQRFRKADNFAFLDEGQIFVKENEHKFSKSEPFFEHFKTLGVDTLYVKALGYKTFLKLEALGIEVYFVPEATRYNSIKPDELVLIGSKNAKEFCTLGHKMVHISKEVV